MIHHISATMTLKRVTAEDAAINSGHHDSAGMPAIFNLTT
jgi:hypothetical protein